MAARNLIAGDTVLRSVKAGDPRGRINDGAGLSLKLFVKGGSHAWRFEYTFRGKRNNISLGTYPDVTLAKARARADEMRRQLQDGVDPSHARKEARVAAVADQEQRRRVAEGLPALGSFEAVAREWLQTVHQTKVSTAHAARTQTRLEQDAFPWIGARPIEQIEPPELLACLRRVESRGAIETAHRVKDACGQVFRFGIAAGYCKRDAAADLREALRPVQTKHHAAIVDPKAAGVLLRDMAAYQGQPVTRVALMLSALLLLRPGELRHLEWPDVDLEGAMLTVPGDRMKRLKADKENGVPHAVPLAPQAVALFRELEPLTGRGKLVFPANTQRDRCMSENTVRSALRRLGYGNDEMTAHGFRAMARTMMAERLDIANEVIEAQLAHAVPDSLGRAYNRTQFLDQRRSMMNQWAAYLDKLRNEAIPTK